jgi:hypothetical protein
MGEWRLEGAFEMEMVFVPEGRCDRSLARSAWKRIPRKNCPVGYGMIGRPHLRGAHTRTNHTVPYGTVFFGWRSPRHFVPGYDRTVPPGQRPFPSQNGLIFAPFTYTTYARPIGPIPIILSGRVEERLIGRLIPGRTDNRWSRERRPRKRSCDRRG